MIIITNYKNKYGSLELELRSEYMPIDDILTENVPDATKFDINVAEQIALITSNRMIQICFGIPKSYVIVHDSQSTAALTRVSIDFISNVSPTEELYFLNKFYTLGI